MTDPLLSSESDRGLPGGITTGRGVCRIYVDRSVDLNNENLDDLKRSEVMGNRTKSILRLQNGVGTRTSYILIV